MENIKIHSLVLDHSVDLNYCHLPIELFLGAFVLKISFKDGTLHEQERIIIIEDLIIKKDKSFHGVYTVKNESNGAVMQLSNEARKVRGCVVFYEDKIPITIEKIFMTNELEEAIKKDNFYYGST